jgi:hypothetical protein
MFVVVLEHYDESLLALRRLMHWPMAEVSDGLLCGHTANDGDAEKPILLFLLSFVRGGV